MNTVEAARKVDAQIAIQKRQIELLEKYVSNIREISLYFVRKGMRIDNGAWLEEMHLLCSQIRDEFKDGMEQ